MNKGWLELESDPGLFTLLLEEIGVHGVQVEEIYDLQKPMEGDVYGFIFLFRWIEERRSRRKTNTEVESFVTDAEAVNNIFFAQQIIPNSCATHALLSVLLNCDSKVKLGETLTVIKDFTDNMSPEDKGFAIANMPELARVHNSFARPETSKPVPEKQSGLSSVRSMDSETFHFVSYVPIRGHLFELDGLKPHPIDHGPCEKGEAWTEKFRRVITDRLGMATGGEPYHDIRFNLMAVVPDKRQLLEHKLVTLRTNRNIVLEALQQLLDAKVVSPASSERSEPDIKVNESKKSVKFTADTVEPGTDPSLSRDHRSSPVSSTLAPHTVIKPKQSATLPASILKPTSNGATSSISSTVPTLETDISEEAKQMKLRSSGSGKPSTFSDSLSKELIPKVEHNDIADSTDTKCQIDHQELNSNKDIKVEAMETSGSELPQSIIPASSSESAVKSELRHAGLRVTSDLTRPLSIETKFSVSPCAASSESTDTASEVGSGFSSPGSLNTSSCQSSPQFSDGTSGTDTKLDVGEVHHHHQQRRKRRSSQAFTPKDLLDLYKNVENEIELCETNLKEENEKRKKYKIDACRRTHNYDQFIVTFLSMLAEQGLLGDLMEENMTIKKPGANTTSTPKMAKKTLLKVPEKKKKKIKKKGKK